MTTPTPEQTRERELLDEAAKIFRNQSHSEKTWDSLDWLEKYESLTKPTDHPIAQPQRSGTGAVRSRCGNCGSLTVYVVAPRPGNWVPCCGTACAERILSAPDAKGKP